MLTATSLVMLSINLKLFLPLRLKSVINITLFIAQLIIFLLIISSVIFSLLGSKPSSYKFPASASEIFDVYKKNNYQIVDSMLMKFIQTIGNSTSINLKSVKKHWKYLRISFWLLVGALTIFMGAQGTMIYFR